VPVGWLDRMLMVVPVGWLDRMLMVVSVVVGFRYMSNSRENWFRIIKSSRKFILLLFPYVRLKWRFGWIRFI